MHLLVEHLHKHFLINMHTIAVIENLHEATAFRSLYQGNIKFLYNISFKKFIYTILYPYTFSSSAYTSNHKKIMSRLKMNLHEATAEMIEFVIRTMYCLGKKNVIVFWEIPTFRNARQIPHVSVEQWNDFIYLLTSKVCHKNRIQILYYCGIQFSIQQVDKIKNELVKLSAFRFIAHQMNYLLSSKNVGQGVLPYCISLDGLLENEVYGKIEENVKDIIGSIKNELVKLSAFRFIAHQMNYLLFNYNGTVHMHNF